jgi:ATP-dependent helicase/nuclease subunit B
MRVFSVPVSAPFLRSVIAALVDGRLVDGFEVYANPAQVLPAHTLV